MEKEYFRLTLQDILLTFNKKIDIVNGKISNLKVSEISVSSEGELALAGKENYNKYFLVDYQNLETIKKVSETSGNISIIYNAPKDFNNSEEFKELIRTSTIMGLYKKNEKRLYFSDVGMYTYK